MPIARSVVPNRSRSGLHSGLDVLECLAASAQGLNLTEIATALGRPKSSVHQTLPPLLERGWVRRQPDARYGVGVKAWEVGCRATFVEIGRVAEPYMAELVRTVHEGVSLGLLDGAHTVCIQIAESPQAVRVHNHVGERNAAHCLSNGLALLATLSDEEVAARLPKKLAKVTPKTIDRLDDLLVELKRVRQRGHAVCRGTWRPDVAGVAVAIRGPDRRAVAGISIALPMERLTVAHLQRLAAGLKAAAAGIEHQLGSAAAWEAPALPTRSGGEPASRMTRATGAARAPNSARRAPMQAA